MSLAVSLVLCTRNGGARLRTCLDHLQAMNWTGPLQLLLVDNGSDDGVSLSILRDYAERTRFQCEVMIVNKRGNGAGRNSAIRSVTGDLVLFIDDDCYVDANFACSWVEVFTRNNIGYASGMIERHSLEQSMLGCVELDQEILLNPGEYVRRGLIQGSNMAFRATCLRQIGYFDERFGAGTPFAGEEWELALRASYAGWAGGYYPQAKVSHDHRRSEAEAHLRLHYYDYGAGAVYLKHLFTRHGGAIRKVVLDEAKLLWRAGTRRRLLSLTKGFLAFPFHAMAEGIAKKFKAETT